MAVVLGLTKNYNVRGHLRESLDRLDRLDKTSGRFSLDFFLVSDGTALVSEAIVAIRSSGAASEMTPIARVATECLSEGLGSDIGDLAYQAAVSSLTAVVAEYATDYLSAIAGEIPLVGAVFDLFAAGVTGAAGGAGVGAGSSSVEERRAFCRKFYDPPVGTGPGGKIMAADLFCRPGFVKGRGIPAVARALRAITEQNSAELVGVLRHQSFQKGFLRLDAGMGTGIGHPRTILYKKLRLAIQGQHKQPGDGGRVLLSIYLDLLRADVDSGRLTERLMRHLVSRRSQRLSKSVTETGESTCLDHDDRGYQEALGLLRGWVQTVRPYYADDPRLNAVERAYRQRIPAERLARFRDRLKPSGKPSGNTY